MSLRTLLIGLLLALTSPVWADPVAQVTSYPCTAKGLQRSGSGIVFEVSERYFLVTSSQAVFHGVGRDDVCHAVRARKLTERPAKLLAVDLFRDLAVLEFAASGETLPFKPLPLIWFRSRDGELSANLTREPLRIVGYGVGAEDPTVNPGLLLDRTTGTYHLPNTSLNRVQGLSRFGMGGGGVFDNRDRLIGMISHLYVSIGPGHPATIEEHRPGESFHGAMITLVVPTPSVIDFVKTVIEKKKIMETFVAEDLAQQIAGRRTVRIGELSFAEVGCRTPASGKGGAAGVGGQGAGVGGQGAGVGGQGAGVGGRDDNTAPGVMRDDCGIEVTRHANAQGQPWPAALGAEVYNATVAGLGVDKKITWHFFSTKPDDSVVFPRGLLQAFALVSAGLVPETYEFDGWLFEGTLKFHHAGFASKQMRPRRVRWVKYIYFRHSLDCPIVGERRLNYQPIGRLKADAPANFVPGSLAALKLGGKYQKVTGDEGGGYYEFIFAVDGGKGAFIDLFNLTLGQPEAVYCQFDIYTKAQ